MIAMKSLQWALLVVIFCDLASAQTCSGADAALAERIGQRFRWSEFWNAEGRYPVGSLVDLELSVADWSVRVCSQTVGRCADFERGIDGLISEGRAGIELNRAQDPVKEARRFLIAHTPSVGPSMQDTVAKGNVFRRGGNLIQVPMSKEGLTGLASKLRRCRYQLPPVANITPPSVLLRTVPSTWPTLKATLEGAVKHHAAEGWRMRYIVPYYSDTDPMVYVIAEANGERSHIDMMKLREGKWERLGPLVPMYEPIGFGRFCDRIEAAGMKTVPE